MVRILLTAFPGVSGETGPSGLGGLAERATRASEGRLACRALPLSEDRQVGLLKMLEVIDQSLPEGVLILERAPAGRSGRLSAVHLYAYNRMETGDGPGGSGTGDPIDPSGPDRMPLGLRTDEAIRKLAEREIAAGPTADPAPTGGNLLAYGILRYVSLRGRETWFRRQPPAGLSTVAGLMTLAANASPEGVVPGALAAFSETLGA